MTRYKTLTRIMYLHLYATYLMHNVRTVMIRNRIARGHLNAFILVLQELDDDQITERNSKGVAETQVFIFEKNSTREHSNRASHIKEISTRFRLLIHLCIRYRQRYFLRELLFLAHCPSITTQIARAVQDTTLKKFSLNLLRATSLKRSYLYL